MERIHVTLNAARKGKAFFEPSPAIGATFRKFFTRSDTVRATTYVQGVYARSSSTVEITRLSPRRFRVISTRGIRRFDNEVDAVNCFFDDFSALVGVDILSATA